MSFESRSRVNNDDEPQSRRRRSNVPDGAEWEHPAAAITCPVCFCDAEPAEAATLAACGHTFCVDCISTYTRGRVEAGEVLGIVCPSVEPAKCGRALTVPDIHRCLEGGAERERYDRLAFQRCIEAGDDLGTQLTPRLCAHPAASDPTRRPAPCPPASQLPQRRLHVRVCVGGGQPQARLPDMQKDILSRMQVCVFQPAVTRRAVACCPRIPHWHVAGGGCDSCSHAVGGTRPPRHDSVCITLPSIYSVMHCHL